MVTGPGQPAGLCRGCGHPVDAHASHGKHRVCTRGYGRVACRECAHGLASLTVERYGANAAERLTADLRRGQSLRRAGSFGLARPVVDGWSNRGGTFGSSMT